MAVREINDGYVIDFTINGKRYRESIPAPFNKTAYKRICDREANYKMAISMDDASFLEKWPNSKIMQKAFADSQDFTVEDYANKWFVRHQSEWSHTTEKGYRKKYLCYIQPNFGQIKLSTFKTSTYTEWAAKQTISGKSLNEVRNILNLIFKEAFYDEVIDKNPIERIKRHKQEHKEPEPFTKDEINKILKALSSPYREFYQFAFYTGLRTGELLAIRWQDVDLSKNVAHIRVNITAGKEKEPKTKGSIRKIGLHNEAIDALGQIRTSKYFNEYRIFTDPRTGNSYMNADGLRKYVWQPALEKAKVKYRYPYQCRHTYASMMLTQGENPTWLANQMGHSDWGMLRKIYGRWISN